MRRIALLVVSIVLAAGGTLVFSNGISQAKAGSADLAVTGLVAGGVKATERFHLIVFAFTLTDNGPDGTGEDSADLVLTNLQGGTIVDIMCVMPHGFGINPDGWFCEPGPLQARQSNQAVYVVQPSGTSTTVSLRVCAQNEGVVPDPVAGNNCGTLAVAIA